MPTVAHLDPFEPVLLDSSSVPLPVSNEQRNYIKEVLETACSDSKFAEKAYAAINRILTAGQTKPPTVTGLTPSSAVIGTPSFDLHVNGTNFTPTSVIVFNGGEEPTVFVSDKELTTGVNMDTVSGPVTVPVLVSSNGIYSDPMMFTFSEATARKSTEAHILPAKEKK